MSQVVKVSARGVWVPRLLIQAWGQVEEVEIEQRPDAIIIKPLCRAGPTRQQIIAEMRAAGLIEDLPWPRPRPVPAAEQARLARKLGTFLSADDRLNRAAAVEGLPTDDPNQHA